MPATVLISGLLREVFDLLYCGYEEEDRMNKPGFWMKKDQVSMARSLRLSVIQNLFDGGHLSEDEARDLLVGPLDPDNDTHYYDDSKWLVADGENRWFE